MQVANHILSLVCLALLSYLAMQLWFRAEYATAAWEQSRTYLEALARTRYGAIDNAYKCYRKEKE